MAEINLNNFQRAAEFVRYGLASALALAVDFGLIKLLIELKFPLFVAAAIGFTSGLLIVYLFSIAWAFERRSVVNRRLEFLYFSLIGVLGLGLTEVFLHVLIGWMGFDLGLAKFCTAGLVFSFNFSARKFLLFSGANDC